MNKASQYMSEVRSLLCIMTKLVSAGGKSRALNTKTRINHVYTDRAAFLYVIQAMDEMANTDSPCFSTPSIRTVSTTDQCVFFKGGEQINNISHIKLFLVTY